MCFPLPTVRQDLGATIKITFLWTELLLGLAGPV